MSRRSVPIVWLPVLSASLMFVFLLAIRHRLPDPVATHWGVDGLADGFTEVSAFPYVALAFTLGVWALLAFVSRLTRKSVVGRRFDTGLPLGMVWFLGSLTALLAMIQIDAVEAPVLPGWPIPTALGLGFIGWYLGLLAAGQGDEVAKTRAPAPAEAPRLGLDANATVVWSEQTPQASFMPILAAGVTLLGLVIGWFVSWWVTLVFLPIVVLLIGSTTYRITAGPRHIEAKGLVFGVPRVRVPLDEVSSVEVGEVSVYDFGGWGIRANLDGESAVVTRTGSALVVHRTDGAVLRISMDDPELAVRVVSTLLDRRR